MSRGNNPSSTDSPFASAQSLDARVCGDVGARLGASRNQRGWTSADVANRLLLSTAQVNGLERADATAFHNPAFFAAALRKYATLMALDCPDAFLTPKSAVTADLKGPRRTHEDPRSTHEDPRRPHADRRRASEAPRRAVRDAPARDTTDAAAAASDAKPSRSSVPMEWLAVAAIVVLSGVGIALYFGGRTPAPVDVASTADLKGPRRTIQEEGSAVPSSDAVVTRPIPSPETVVKPPIDHPDAALPEALSTSAPSTPAPVATDPPAPVAPTPVGDAPAGLVTLARPAWVFVRYGDNSVVERTLQAGQSLTLTSAPIYLAIGAGDGVTLTIRERAIDVSPFRNGNEIRLRASDLAALAR